MPKRGKNLLKNLFKGSSSSSSAPQPPNAFLCPISGYLMSDPVIVPEGHTFERAAFEACHHLLVKPPLLSPITALSSDSPALIPNLAIKIAILNWCNSLGIPHPLPLSQEAARALAAQIKDGLVVEAGTTTSHQEPSAVGPSTAARSRAYRPQAIKVVENDIFTDLQSSDSSSRESALQAVNEFIRHDSENRVYFCTERIVALIIPILYSLNNSLQVKAVAAMGKFMTERPNRRKIVQWGGIPGILHVLINGDAAAQSYAVRAINDMSREENNKISVGSMNAMPLLLRCFCDRNLRVDVRRFSGLALYALTLSPVNLQLFEEMKPVEKLLAIVTDKSSHEIAMGHRSRAMSIMYNMVDGDKGREELIDAKVVEVMLRMIREREGMDLQCLAMMHWICMQCPVKFREVVAGTGAEDVLTWKNVGWGEDGEKMAKQMMDVILHREGRIRDEDEISQPDVRSYFFEYEEDEEEQEDEVKEKKEDEVEEEEGKSS